MRRRISESRRTYRHTKRHTTHAIWTNVFIFPFSLFHSLSLSLSFSVFDDSNFQKTKSHDRRNIFRLSIKKTRTDCSPFRVIRICIWSVKCQNYKKKERINIMYRKEILFAAFSFAVSFDYMAKMMVRFWLVGWLNLPVCYISSVFISAGKLNEPSERFE